MQGEDFNLSNQNLTWPKAMQRTKHFLKIILGFMLLTMGAAMLLLPGPGWLTIGLGLMVLAAEFTWARRLLKGPWAVTGAQRTPVGTLWLTYVGVNERVELWSNPGGRQRMWAIA